MDFLVILGCEGGGEVALIKMCLCMHTYFWKMIWIGQIGCVYAQCSQIHSFKSMRWKGFEFTSAHTRTSIKFSIYLTEITWWWWWWEFSFCINEFSEKILSGICCALTLQSVSQSYLMVCEIGKSLPQAQSQILWKSLNRMAAWIDCFLCATSTL